MLKFLISKKTGMFIFSDDDRDISLEGITILERRIKDYLLELLKLPDIQVLIKIYLPSESIPEGYIPTNFSRVPKAYKICFDYLDTGFKGLVTIPTDEETLVDPMCFRPVDLLEISRMF